MIAFFNDDFLYMRYLARRNLYTKVSPCNHHTICRIDDAVDVLHTLRIFDLGNDINTLSSVCHKELTDFVNCLCISDKRSRYKINILFNTKEKISFVFLREVRKIDRNVWYIHTLLLSELAAVYYGTDNFRCIYFFYAQADQTIIDQNCVSLFDIFRKACVADRTVIFISGLLNGCQGEGLSGYQIYFFAIFQNAGTDFRSFGIQKDCHRSFQLFSKLFQHIHTHFLLFVVSMRKIKTSNIHSGFNQFFHQVTGVGIWSHGADNFRSSHTFSPSLFYMFMCKQVILAVFIVSVASGTETELQIRIIFFGPAADRTFVFCDPVRIAVFGFAS